MPDATCRLGHWRQPGAGPNPCAPLAWSSFTGPRRDAMVSVDAVRTAGMVWLGQPTVSPANRGFAVWRRDTAELSRRGLRDVGCSAEKLSAGCACQATMAPPDGRGPRRANSTRMTRQTDVSQSRRGRAGRPFMAWRYTNMLHAPGIGRLRTCQAMAAAITRSSCLPGWASRDPLSVVMKVRHSSASPSEWISR